MFTPSRKEPKTSNNKCNLPYSSESENSDSEFFQDNKFDYVMTDEANKNTRIKLPRPGESHFMKTS